ncbi:type IVB secretion system protein IcmH/DotU [Pasteurella atlantica]|uniref:Type IVB secretion system protein IcmH/DotU n=2 Tax=Pasteurellaceae TaxID=712 RepID=A0ACC6HPA4_9PAST|nr:type IVB secretion system protein IcmH/DotU [Pasteurella atlantica]MDP8052628.1 type IVB secretion system protein IcmH/DotU [Pasteurella atlantica]MDP8105772.1 type IVB secretion system protein IcmH/DotU [Pasteurella atlantica]MDP8149286.1 type IVB secretion system protein IcmH/DotU [Pasteurella atlantica]
MTTQTDTVMAPDSGDFSQKPTEQFISNKKDLLYEQVGNIDFDVDFDFNLRGSGYNKMIDLANPILLLALRLKKAHRIEDVQGLYERVKNEVTAITEEMKNLQYDSAVQLSFRYCLCTFIDEMVMSTKWGMHSIWAQRSLLAKFHNETWGGEKFYSILKRIMLEPEKYKELLEFIYLCLALGYRGRYAQQAVGVEKIQELITTLHDLLREQRGEVLKKPFKINLYKKDYSFKRSISLWKVSLSVFIILVVVYISYSISLDEISQNVINNIEFILK